MRRAQVDMWVLVAREYNEDPVVETMLPATWLAARRRTVLVFHDRGPEQGVERLAVARYDVGRFFAKAWDKEAQPDQWKALADLIVARDPLTIALNVSPTFALADGMSQSQHDGLLAALPEEYAQRIVSGQDLAIGWLETRTAAEMEVYPTICRIAHVIIAEGLSSGVIQPGVTTTKDVEWWYRERIRELKLATWFHPSVSLQRAEEEGHSGTFASKPGERVIRRGDLLHVDFGITYLGLNTDTQQHAYVLRSYETEAPAGLMRGLVAGNRMQDILTECFVAGRTGKRDPGLRAGASPRGGPAPQRLHAPARLPRPRRGADHRAVGPAGRRPRQGRLPALRAHLPLDRAERHRVDPGVGRQGREDHARGGRLLRR